jgi:hypothetical protein
MAARKIYRIKFRAEEKIYEVYARKVGPGELFGFIEVSELMWGEKSAVIIDPTEQELRHEFAGVKRFQVPMHAVVRVDEVEKSGSAKVISIPAGGKDDRVPSPIYTPGPKTK